MSPDFLNGELTEWQRSAINSTGPVLISQLSLLRNVSPYPFPVMMEGGEKKNLCEKVQKEILQKTDFSEINLKHLSPDERAVLDELHFMESSPGEDYPLFIDSRRKMRIQLLRENHIRLDINPSFKDMEKGMNGLLELSTILEEKLAFSKADQFGYLTNSLIHSGLGLECSLLLHLPALKAAGAMDRIEEIALSGHFLLEKAGDHENLYYLRNLSAVYETPAALVEAFTVIAEKICEEEGEIRSLYKDSGHPCLEDLAFRALGTLRYSRIISRKEAQMALLMLRFGIQMEWISGIKSELVTVLYFLMGKGHIKKIISIENTVPVDDNLINLYRGELLRRVLKKEERS